MYTAYSFYDVDIDLNNLGGYGPDLYDGDGNFNPEFIRYKNFGVDVSLKSGEYPTSFADDEEEAIFRMAEGIVVDAYSEFIRHTRTRSTNRPGSSCGSCARLRCSPQATLQMLLW